MAKQSVDSLDYLLHTGTKEVRDNLLYHPKKTYPWNEQEIEHNKKIVLEYLDYSFAQIDKKIKG
jgi:hypothetical protein|tara:strand:+ start:98 stop:289 length:192 start_codon:yes stop_codon:yes gene_type:complete